MRKVLIVTIMASLFFFGSSKAGHCQDFGGDDSAIEQSESQMGQDLSSEINSEQSEAQSEVGQIDSSMSVE